MKNRLLRIVSVCITILLVLYFFSALLTPTWDDWNNDNTIKGFYREPENRLQVIFLGTSKVITGISPIELYDRFGICGYNLGTEVQPLIASYYWIKEAYRLHNGTLNTVVLDVSFLLKKDPNQEDSMIFAEKALTHMKLSPVKIEALKECEKLYDGFNAIDYLIPLRRYHSRWSSLSKTDFDGLLSKNNVYYTRGQRISFDFSIDHIDDAVRNVPNYSLTDESDYSEEEYEAEWDKENKRVFENIVDFCNEKGLNLVLIRIPRMTNDLQSDAIRYLSEQYNVPLIDFNCIDLQNKIGFSFSLDFEDNSHPNVYGSEKITDYIGEYILDNFSIKSIRDDDRYEYLRRQSEKYQIIEEDKELKNSDSFEEYLNAIDRDRYTVIISAKDEAASGLSENHRKILKDYGFTQLSNLEFRNGYIGIRDRGKIILDKSSIDASYLVSADGTIDSDGRFVLNNTYIQSSSSLTERREPEGSLKNGASVFTIKSGGLNAGNISSIVVNGNEYSDNGRGLNVVVYDNELGLVIDQSTFDTHSKEANRTDLALTGEYTLRVDRAELMALNSFREFVDVASEKDLTVVLFGTATGAQVEPNEEDKTFFFDCGLRYFDIIDERPYFAILDEGISVYEKTAPIDQPFTVHETNYGLFSFWARKDPNENARMAIGNNKYTIEENKIFALAYNNVENEVVYAKAFEFGDISY